ncbi:DUF3021 domain-containing protein [Lactobacillus sp. PV034]|uniref:DUF3021 domain-containing protein n=1 Tax=Lactobacillus sp. PV034 TaxID=2594495 RepID=UPI002240B144|nr:DUF3021 domain-containing protein [Lactobacillus sp. PV034]QNQ80377.1 DUF3021 domain-containing protein [Lactobacillus sp. PV034]
MKKHIFLLINGIAWGEVYGLAFSIFFSYIFRLNTYAPSTPAFTEHFTRPLDAVLASIILWGLMGLLFSAGALVFKVKNWSLRKQTIINFIIYYFGFTPLAILAGWFPCNLVWLTIFTIIFILIYLVMWSINVYIFKREVRKINQKLQK